MSTSAGPPPGTEVDVASLYRAHFDAVLRFFLKHGVAARDASDLAQLVFVTAIQKRATIPGEAGAARAWLLTTAQNKLSNFRRRTSEHLLGEDILAEEMAPQDSEQRLMDAQLIAMAIAEMPEGMNRKVFVEVFLEGRTEEALAAELGTSESTVRSWLSRGRAEFRAIHARLSGEPERDEGIGPLDKAMRTLVVFFLLERSRVWRNVQELCSAVELEAHAPRVPAGPSTRPRLLGSVPSRFPGARFAQLVVGLPLILAPIPSLAPASPDWARSSPAAIIAARSSAHAGIRAEAPAPTEPVQVEPVPSHTPPVSPRPAQVAQRRDERRLLDQATERLLRGDAAEALVLLELHANEFRDSRFAEEREGCAIQALITLGRKEEADMRLQRLQDRFPESQIGAEIPGR